MPIGVASLVLGKLSPLWLAPNIHWLVNRTLNLGSVVRTCDNFPWDFMGNLGSISQLQLGIEIELAETLDRTDFR